ncbi:MAG: hypothetical protein Q9M12_08545, partial [Mariprofundus sp.]|nr:hypothetical protein [Mariprofundus sp.]
MDHIHRIDVIRARHCTLPVIAGLLFLSATAYAADDTAVIQVEGNAPVQLDSITIKPDEQTFQPVDSTDYLKSAAGANVNKNGPMTGIVQYRGM